MIIQLTQSTRVIRDIPRANKFIFSWIEPFFYLLSCSHYCLSCRSGSVVYLTRVTNMLISIIHICFFIFIIVSSCEGLTSTLVVSISLSGHSIGYSMFNALVRSFFEGILTLADLTSWSLPLINSLILPTLHCPRGSFSLSNTTSPTFGVCKTAPLDFLRVGFFLLDQVDNHFSKFPKIVSDISDHFSTFVISVVPY